MEGETTQPARVVGLLSADWPPLIHSFIYSLFIQSACMSTLLGSEDVAARSREWKKGNEFWKKILEGGLKELGEFMKDELMRVGTEAKSDPGGRVCVEAKDPENTWRIRVGRGRLMGSRWAGLQAMKPTLVGVVSTFPSVIRHVGSPLLDTLGV